MALRGAEALATAVVAPVAAHSGICESSSDKVTRLESLSSSGITGGRGPSSSLISSLVRRRFCGAASVADASALVAAASVAAAAALVAAASVGAAAAAVWLPPVAGGRVAVVAAWLWLPPVA